MKPNKEIKNLMLSLWHDLINPNKKPRYLLSAVEVAETLSRIGKEPVDTELRHFASLVCSKQFNDIGSVYICIDEDDTDKIMASVMVPNGEHKIHYFDNTKEQLFYFFLKCIALKKETLKQQELEAA